MQAYEYVKSIVSYYAYWDFQEVWREEHPFIEIDFERTTRNVWKQFASRGVLAEARKQPTKDRQTEYLHLSILDYFSSHEPVVKEKV